MGASIEDPTGEATAADIQASLIAGQNVKLAANAQISGTIDLTIPGDTEVTLDLNGGKITASGYALILRKGKLTVKKRDPTGLWGGGDSRFEQYERS